MYDDLLVPTDGSDRAEAALDHAIEIAGPRDATIHALYVVDDRAFITLHDDMTEEVSDELRTDGEKAVASLAAAAEDAGIEVTTAVRQGDPAEEIVAYVEEAGIDLVTMATRGEGNRRNMLGSVSRDVIGEADVPVLTVGGE